MICKTNFKDNTTLTITWNSFGAFSSKPDELQSSDVIPPEVKELVQKLAKVANVKRVVAIALRFPDIHWIDFELELQPETELSDEIWYKVQDLVIDYEWKLRDDSGEKWYFHAQPVNELSKLRDPAHKVADSDPSQSTGLGRQTWSSPPLNFTKSESFLELMPDGHFSKTPVHQKRTY